MANASVSGMSQEGPPSVTGLELTVGGSVAKLPQLLGVPPAKLGTARLGRKVGQIELWRAEPWVWDRRGVG